MDFSLLVFWSASLYKVLCFSLSPGQLNLNRLTAIYGALEGVLLIHSSRQRHSKVRANAEGEDRSFWWGLKNIGVSSRLPSLQLLLSTFSRRGWRRLEHSSPQISTPPSAHHPLTVIKSICNPTPCFIYVVCGFFRPVVAYFLPL